MGHIVKEYMSVSISSINYCPVKSVSFQNINNCEIKKDSGIELFSGEFWSGRKAKDLGLIDDIGNANQILREKFGEDVVIKKFEKSKSWLSKKLSSSNDHVDQLANILEEKSVWQKYGL